MDLRRGQNILGYIFRSLRKNLKYYIAHLFLRWQKPIKIYSKKEQMWNRKVICILVLVQTFLPINQIATWRLTFHFLLRRAPSPWSRRRRSCSTSSGGSTSSRLRPDHINPAFTFTDILFLTHIIQIFYLGYNWRTNTDNILQNVIVKTVTTIHSRRVRDGVTKYCRGERECFQKCHIAFKNVFGLCPRYERYLRP